MISVLILTADADGESHLEADLARVGIHCLGAVASDELVRRALERAPDLILVHDPAPEPRTFEALRALQATAPRPVVMFAAGIVAAGIGEAVASGVHALVVTGYDGRRLRATMQLAQARFHQEQQLRSELAELRRRYEERKLVDRAKGILMRATQLPEEEAFRLLRSASMRGNRRVGQVSREVIDAARYAEAVNRAGQLRMLSQRLVKLHALLASGTDPSGTGALLAQTVERADANLARLADAPAQASYGDLLQPIQDVWKQLRRPAATRANAAARLEVLDAHAERLLTLAEQLTASLELDGGAKPLHLINVCGRQRMLSQRAAKFALLGALAHGEAADAARGRIPATVAEFEASLQYLAAIPLATQETRDLLATARREWTAMAGRIGCGDSADGRIALAGASEALLETFDRLTGIYERSMAILTDPQFSG